MYRPKLTDTIERRLAVPCLPSELAAILDEPVRLIRPALYSLRKQGRVQRLDRTIRKPGRGRAEYFWMAA